jgi:hypothetical protein
MCLSPIRLRSKLCSYFCRMELTFNTPALLFPAISLLLLAYTNRFLALASLIRQLSREHKGKQSTDLMVQQIKSLHLRLNIIKYMQGLGILSFLNCVITMYCIYSNWMYLGKIIFGISLLSLLISLFLSLVETVISTKALELELGDI